MPEATPSHVPEITLRVNGREWRGGRLGLRSRSDRGDQIVREDAKGEQLCAIRRRRTGAVLRGTNNVTAEYRTGIGALGSVKAGAKPSAGAKLDNLDNLTLAGEVTHGAASEDAEKARFTAPAKLQSLGRLVSLPDYETETLTIKALSPHQLRGRSSNTPLHPPLACCLSRLSNPTRSSSLSRRSSAPPTKPVAESPPDPGHAVRAAIRVSIRQLRARSWS